MTVDSFNKSNYNYLDLSCSDNDTYDCNGSYLSLTPLSDLSPHSNHACNLSPLPQVDGNDSIILTPAHDSPSHPPQPTGAVSGLSHPSAQGVKQKTYVMNKGRQVKKLGKDTLKPDLTIKISQNNQNVNIQCNTGFYMQVVIPGLKGLATGCTNRVSGIDVLCSDIVGNIDAGGSDLNTVLHFRFHQDKLPVGGVTVHLHHSTRLVQVQGGGVLPDKSHAPVWFVQHYLKSRLSRLSTEKAKEVSIFNQQVYDMVSSYLNSSQSDGRCAGCGILFSKRSVPEHCQTCGKYYHKKCFPSDDHPCRIKSRPRSCSAVSPHVSSSRQSHLYTTTTAQSARSVAPLPPLQHTTTNIIASEASVAGAPLATSAHPSQSVSVLSNTGVSTPAVCPASNSGSSDNPPSMPGTSNQLLLCSNNDPGLHLNPDAQPFISARDAHDLPSHKQTKNNGKGSKNKTAPVPDLTLEYAQYTVNVSQAKIREQEITIKDLRFKNEILEARVAELEKKQKEEIYNRYFPLPSSTPTPQHNTQQQGQCHSHISCHPGALHHTQPCCKHKLYSCQQQSTTCHSLETFIEEQTKKFANLQSAIDDMKYKVELLSDVTIPQLKRTVCHSSPARPSPVPSTGPPPAQPPSYTRLSPVPPTPDCPTPRDPPPSSSGAPSTTRRHISQDKEDLSNVSQMTIDDAIHDVSSDLN